LAQAQFNAPKLKDFYLTDQNLRGPHSMALEISHLDDRKVWADAAYVAYDVRMIHPLFLSSSPLPIAAG
jgi:hypothetical protein